MSDGVFTVAATNLVKDSSKEKGPDTGYFYKVGDKISADDVGDIESLIVSGAVVASEQKPEAPAEKDKA